MVISHATSHISSRLLLLVLLHVHMHDPEESTLGRSNVIYIQHSVFETGNLPRIIRSKSCGYQRGSTLLFLSGDQQWVQGRSEKPVPVDHFRQSGYSDGGGKFSDATSITAQPITGELTRELLESTRISTDLKTTYEWNQFVINSLFFVLCDYCRKFWRF